MDVDDDGTASTAASTAAASTAGGGGAVQSRSQAKKYPCGECGEEYVHRQMVKSMRKQHVMYQADWDRMLEAKTNDTLGKARYQNREWLKLFKKICLQCEVKERRKEKQERPNDFPADYDEPATVAEVIRKESHSEASRNRGHWYNEARKEVDEQAKYEGWSKRQRAMQRTAKMKDLCQAFLKALVDGGLWEAFSAAGRRIREASRTWQQLEELDAAIQKEVDTTKKVMLQAKYEQEQAKFEAPAPPSAPLASELPRLPPAVRHPPPPPNTSWDFRCRQAQHFYETYKENAQQDDCIRALDYEDRMVPGQLCTFYVCRARCGYEECGYYYPGKFWKGNSMTFMSNKWYCGVDWSNACAADPSIKDEMVKRYGEDMKRWPQIGCGAKYMPWARGEGMVMEIYTEKSGWLAFLADLMPEIIDDEIKKVQSTWANALGKLTPEEIYECIPCTYPQCHKVKDAQGRILPGVSRFPIEQWKKDGSPRLDTVGWLRLVSKIASKDSKNLECIFRTSEEQLAKENERLSAFPSLCPRRGAAPPPPPPGPPPPWP